jgi:hypothetical protein
MLSAQGSATSMAQLSVISIAQALATITVLAMQLIIHVMVDHTVSSMDKFYVP